MNPDLPLCETCGAVLDPSAPGGLCRRCLLAQAMQSTEPSAKAERQPPPSIETVQAAFPQLEILEFIGQGGMGWVFKARQPKLNRFVAVKLLPSSLAERDAAFAGRFEREGQLLARLHHPNIVAVHDSGAAGGFFYLLMEYVEGVNLGQAMRSSRFTPAQALAIVPHICDALQFAHDEGVLHRDIKPENILLDAKGRVKLADFGIAKLIGAADALAGESAAADPDLHLTHAGATLGTPSYMAPEQRDTPADVDERADIYSLGVVFYELLTGELPTGSFAPPSTKSAADPRVDAIVQQALEKERTRRQSSAGEMKTQVETISGSFLSAPECAADRPVGPPRAVNKPSIGSNEDPSITQLKAMLRGSAIAVSCVAFMCCGFMVFLNLSSSSALRRGRPESIIPLQLLPTAALIRVGLSNPFRAGPWLELAGRPLTDVDAGHILDGLTVWLHKEHSESFTESQSGLDPLLRQLAKRGLASDDQATRFLEAYEGGIRCEPLLRLREGAQKLDLNVRCRNWSQAPLGLVMMNELQAVTVDGQSLVLQGAFRYWEASDLHDSLPMPALARGKHAVKLEVVSALVPEGELANLSPQAPAAAWPPAKKRWTRTAETELLIYPRDAVIVSQTEDPALDPVASGALSVKKAIIRSTGDKAQAVLSFNMSFVLPVPISFDVILRAGDQSIPCGKLWAGERWTPDSLPDTRSGQELTSALISLSPAIEDASIVLTPNSKYVEHIGAVDRIWGKEIVFSRVPLIRQNLTNPTASASP